MNDNPDKGDSSKEAPDNLAEQIDKNLKRVYQEVLDEGIPDRFAELLARLKDKSGDPSDGPS